MMAIKADTVLDSLVLFCNKFSIEVFTKFNQHRVFEANLEAFLAPKNKGQSRRCSKILKQEYLKIKERKVYSFRQFKIFTSPTRIHLSIIINRNSL